MYIASNEEKYQEQMNKLIEEVCDMHNAAFEKDPKVMEYLIGSEVGDKLATSSDVVKLRKKYRELYAFIIQDPKKFIEYWKKNNVNSVIAQVLLFYDTINFNNQMSSVKEYIAEELLPEKNNNKEGWFSKLKSHLKQIKSYFFSRKDGGLLAEIEKQKLLYCLYGQQVMLLGNKNAKDVCNRIRRSTFGRNFNVNFISNSIDPDVVKLYNRTEQNNNNITIFQTDRNNVDSYSIFSDDMEKSGRQAYGVFKNFMKELADKDNKINFSLTSVCRGNWYSKSFFEELSRDNEFKECVRAVNIDFNSPLIFQNNSKFMKCLANACYNDTDNLYKLFFLSNGNFIHPFGALEVAVNHFFEEYINLLEKETDKEKQLDAIIRLQDRKLLKLFLLDDKKEERLVSIGSNLENCKKELSKYKRKLSEEKKKSLQNNLDIHDKYICLAEGMQKRMNAFIEKHNLSSDLKRKRKEKQQAKQQATGIIHSNQMQNINNNSNQNNILNLTNTQNNVTTVSQQ